MRVILTLLLLLQVLRATGQSDTTKVLAFDDAIAIALLNNPSFVSDADQKKLLWNISSTWFYLLLQLNEIQLLQEHFALLCDLDRVAALHYQEGNIELLEKSAFLAKLAESKANIAILDNEINITGNHLRKLMNCHERVVPADTNLFLYEINKNPFGDHSYRDSDTASKIENLRLKLESYFIKLQYFKTTGLDHAVLILHVNLVKFRTEEIDYLEYTLNISEAFAIRQKYLKILNDYNQTALELEYYVN